MKKLFKTKVNFFLMLIVFCLNVKAQEGGGVTGTNLDTYIINNDSSNHFGRLRLQDGANFGWTFENSLGNLLLKYSTSADLNVFGDIKWMFSKDGNISGNGNIATNGNIGTNGNIATSRLSVGFTSVTNLYNGQIQIDNTLTNRKIILFEGANNDHQFFGFGINNNILRYQVNSLNDNHVFYAGNSATGSNELMRIQGNGNVGIGTTSPTEKLQVNGIGRFAGLKMEGSARFANNSGGLVWGSSDYNTGYYSRIMDDGNLRILTDDAFYIGKLNGDGTRGTTTILADVVSGKVGIGTEIPQGKLHIYEATGSTLSPTAGSLVLEHGNSGGQSSILFKSNTNNGSDSGWIKYSDDDSGNGSSTENSLLEIGVGNDGSTVHQDDIALMSSGNVGIGTRSPSQKLHVVGNSFMNGQMGVGRDVKSGVALAVKGSLNVTDNFDKTVFHVSTGLNKVFVGTDAYDRFIATTATGTITTSDYSLWVSKGVNATDFIMSDLSTWNDFVFAKEYKLPTLKETESYIATNKHLPYIPSEADVIKNGYSVHNMNRGFLQTIEEMTLHSIAQEKEINLLKNELAEIKALLLAKK